MSQDVSSLAVIGAGTMVALDSDRDGDIDLKDIFFKLNRVIGKTIQRVFGQKIVDKIDVDDGTV